VQERHIHVRLTLNILLSFAQFEREIISERTRDKIAAARRKGKWSGGKPLLGYDVLAGPGGTKLVVNEDEAHRVRAIYEVYLKHEALIPTLKNPSKARRNALGDAPAPRPTRTSTSSCATARRSERAVRRRTMSAAGIAAMSSDRGSHRFSCPQFIVWTTPLNFQAAGQGSIGARVAAGSAEIVAEHINLPFLFQLRPAVWYGGEPGRRRES
jgi:hypothetical protein